MDYNKKIAFFDIDGTLTSEVDGSIPQSAITAIQQARKNGNLMFINTGRCLQNVEDRFLSIGFDGIVAGCGTNILCNDKEILYTTQTHNITLEILDIARKTGVDLLFESRDYLAFDLSRPLVHPASLRHYNGFVKLNYNMPTNFDDPAFCCDKFVIWYMMDEQLVQFRTVSDQYFDCIDRGGTFREFVPYGYSKATGIQKVLDYYKIPLQNAYAFGDSNNDLAMLTYLPNSVAMGNSEPVSLFDKVSYVTSNSSNHGIEKALKHFQFI